MPEVVVIDGEEYEVDSPLESLGSRALNIVGLGDEDEDNEEEMEFEEFEFPAEAEFDQVIPGEVIVVGGDNEQEFEEFEEGDDYARRRRKPRIVKSKSRKSSRLSGLFRRKSNSSIGKRISTRVRVPKLGTARKLARASVPGLTFGSAIRSKLSPKTKPKSKVSSSVKKKFAGLIFLVVLITIVWFLIKQVPVVGPIADKVNQKVSSVIKNGKNKYR